MSAKVDYPLELAGAHGRIAAYRFALEDALHALTEAYPYVNGVALDAAADPWRTETAKGILERIDAARKRAAAELAVTNP
jgi:hypothetical protein